MAKDKSKMGALTQGISPLVNAWTKVGAAIGFAQFSVAGLQQSINLFQIPPAGIVFAVKLKHSQAFAAVGLLTCTASVGIAGSLAKYCPAFDVMQAVGPTIFQVSAGSWSEDISIATQVLLTVTSTGANLNLLSAGMLDIWAMQSVAN